MSPMNRPAPCSESTGSVSPANCVAGISVPIMAKNIAAIWLRVTAERAVSRGMGGSCSVPLAAYATLEGDTLFIRAAWGDPEGKLPLVRAEQRAVVTTLAQADAVGLAIAQALQAAGAQVHSH